MNSVCLELEFNPRQWSLTWGEYCGVFTAALGPLSFVWVRS